MTEGKSKLRERLDDIPALVDVLLSRVSRHMGVPLPTVTDDAMDKLLSYAYPGNVRELENILERAVTLCTDDRIEPEDIQLKQGQLLFAYYPDREWLAHSRLLGCGQTATAGEPGGTRVHIPAR